MLWLICCLAILVSVCCWSWPFECCTQLMTTGEGCSGVLNTRGPRGSRRLCCRWHDLRCLINVLHPAWGGLWEPRTELSNVLFYKISMFMQICWCGWSQEVTRWTQKGLSRGFASAPRSREWRERADVTDQSGLISEPEMSWGERSRWIRSMTLQTDPGRVATWSAKSIKAQQFVLEEFWHSKVKHFSNSIP